MKQNTRNAYLYNRIATRRNGALVYFRTHKRFPNSRLKENK